MYAISDIVDNTVTWRFLSVENEADPDHIAQEWQWMWTAIVKDNETGTLYETVGNTHAAARASTWLALADQFTGRTEQAIERLEQAYAVIAEDEPDADLAFLLAQLALLKTNDPKLVQTMFYTY